MTDDLVNQLTLNYLISKQQLQKLNRKARETSEIHKIQEIQVYSDKIKILFEALIVFQPPEDLFYEVKTAFDNFIEKSIYYLKAHDNYELLDIESKNTKIQEDINFKQEKTEIETEDEETEDEETEDEETENKETKNEETEDEETEDEETEDEIGYKDDNKNNKSIVHQPFIHQQHIVKSKYKNPIYSDDIPKLPLDWFQNIRRYNYKKND